MEVCVIVMGQKLRRVVVRDALTMQSVKGCVRCMEHVEIETALEEMMDGIVSFV